jgi:hypothetical protein
VSFTSLSKRSNVPGLRSGFVAGDAALIKAFLLYRTYHGSAMSPVVQAASIAAWGDEAHVVANRALYRKKFAQVTPLLAGVMDVALPDAGFYLWAGCPAALGMTTPPSPAPAGSIQCHRAARQLPGPRGRRAATPAQAARPHGPGGRHRRMRGSRAAHRLSSNPVLLDSMTQQLQTLIDAAWENRANLSPASAPKEVRMPSSM